MAKVAQDSSVSSSCQLNADNAGISNPQRTSISDDAGLISHTSSPVVTAGDEPRVALLVIAHTPLASALKDVAQHVFGEDIALTAIDVLPGACAVDSSDALVKHLLQLNRGAGVLIMTDLPGASPSNVCASAASKVRELHIPCHVVTGVNAAMILRAISHRGRDLEALVKAVLAGASQAVMRLD